MAKKKKGQPGPMMPQGKGKSGMPAGFAPQPKKGGKKGGGKKR